MRRLFLAALIAVAGSPAWAGSSVYLTAPDDPAAVWVKGAGDGKADDSAALQKAIDEAAGADRSGGIVFLPSGTYRISRTIFVKPAVRIFGVGPTRPVILLGDRTPGFTSGVSTMLSFTGNDQYVAGKVAVPPPTSVPFDPAIFDATSSTFYSAIANVDFRIGAGNAGATAVRFRTAQHSFIRHSDFWIGSGFAGIYQAGNECEDLHFHGGRYGIVSEKTSPAWQFTLIDSSFDGQRVAAIREHEVDLTLVNASIRDVPVGIEIDRGYSDSLWGKDVRFDNVSKAGVVISSEDSAFTQIGFDNAIARNTPVFARFRDSGRTVAGPAPLYRVASFNYGLEVPALGEMGSFATNMQAEPLSGWPAAAAPAIRPLPPVADWVNVRTLGVKGDDQSDDTAALQKAIDANRVLYLPMGRYKVSDTLRLRPDTVLIALHPSRTQIYLPDDVPAYSGVGSAKALIESAKGGDAIVTGFGLWTGTVNPRATALLWRAGEASMVNDVKIQGGAGTILGTGTQSRPPEESARLDSQHPSIWVTDGGGGTFAAVWSPNTIAQAGFYVSDTDTPGHVYELSAEHHYRNEIVLDHVRNWEFLAPQTEQEVRDGVDAISTEIRNSSNILFANYHGYRVTRTIKPALAAVKLYDSGAIRFRNVHVNAESGFSQCDSKGCGTYLRASKYPFENAILDVTGKREMREREFAALDIPPPGPPADQSQVPVTPGVRQLETGFWSIGGAAADSKGKLYFIDRWFQRIYGWSSLEGLSIVSEAPLDPVNLAVDSSGHLLVLSSAGRDGTAYSLDPANPGEVRTIAPTAVRDRPDSTVLLPVNWWDNGEFRDQLNPKTYQFTTLAEMFARDAGTPKAEEYVSPDGSLALPAFRVWNQGPEDYRGWRWSDTLDSYGWVGAKAGQRLFVTNESEDRTYSATVGPGGSLIGLKPFANRGGESVATGPDGNVYVANGQVFVYSPDGRPVRRIDIPERPLQLVFGGTGGRTLFILTHHSLYAIDI